MSYPIGGLILIISDGLRAGVNTLLRNIMNCRMPRELVEDHEEKIHAIA